MAIRYSEEAERDLREIWQYIAIENADAADRMIRRVHQKLEVCEMFPDSGRARPKVGPGVRSVAAGNYLTFYTHDDAGIHVARVIDGRRDLGLAFGMAEGALDD